MYLELQAGVRRRFVQAVQETFGLEVAEPVVDVPPRLEMGDLSIAACFELAKKLRQSPRQVAEQLAPRLLPIRRVERVSVAGAGYLNFYLDRGAVAARLLRPEGVGEGLHGPPAPRAEARTGAETSVHPAQRTWEHRKGAPLQTEAYPAATKIVIEHTSINPNKSAHIGHLRNAVLGDTFVRLRRFRGERVEVQNYIDNTGVQVADVVVGFIHLEKKSLADIQRLIQDPKVRFDYFCWDLYARVSETYERDKDSLRLRLEALKAIEEGRGEEARMADLIATAIVRLHLQTMWRINVEYDLLVQESEILRLDFWKYAFELLKRNGAVRYEQSGKNAGCWVMSLEDAGSNSEDEESGSEDVKIIVRSNGTVTYVGKDIAYHLWKFGLLGKDFSYEPFHNYPDRHTVWRTAVSGPADAPSFGKASVAYAVIDSRQSYLQKIVVAAFRELGYREQAAHLHHFAYEVVGLSPGCAEEMGLKLSEEDRRRNYVEVSGRKGLGIKADDLIDALEQKALEEVRAREMTREPDEQAKYARMIAVGALRYFLLKFSRRMMIAFDFKEALAFEGETGPYLQYSVVRARNIFRKFQEENPSSLSSPTLAGALSADQSRAFYSGPDGAAFWELTVLAAQLEMIVEQAISSTEPAALAKYGFRLAQAFNNFYQRFHILSELDPARQAFLLSLVGLASATLGRTLDLLGIEIPERM